MFATHPVIGRLTFSNTESTDLSVSIKIENPVGQFGFWSGKYGQNVCRVSQVGVQFHPKISSNKDSREIGSSTHGNTDFADLTRSI